MELWDGERIGALRRALGLSQAELARRMGVRQQTVSEWETGRYRPRGASVTVLAMLAEEAAVYEPGPPPPGSPAARAAGEN